MDGGWSNPRPDSMSIEDTVRNLQVVLEQLKNMGGQVLLYPGKNRTLVVYSKGNKVHLITEAVGG